MNDPVVKPWLRRGLLVGAVMLLALAACVTPPRGPTVRLQQSVREVPGGEPRWQAMPPVRAGVQVWRGGQTVTATNGMLLRPGDEVQTGAQAAAMLVFSDAGQIFVDHDSRVRIGSLEVLFGRIWAELRNRFEVSSESVVAAVEGTSFLFEVQPRRLMRVAVADGAVTCRSRNNDWSPFTLRSRQALLSVYPDKGAPNVGSANAAELAGLAQRAGAIRDAPSRGWCCRAGQTVPSWSNECRNASFGEIEGLVELFCKREAQAAEPVQWCCHQGKVSPARAGQCAGSIHASEALAQRACYAIR